MERNWLIRTTQNQILGPVTKFKVVEFFNKGALGGNDEVMSGNGYWFSLKEKDLVEKYLLGDVPQDYNPVSEAKTVLVRRVNPEKTSSLNAASTKASDIIKYPDMSGSVAPVSSSDLEYPDITVVNLSLDSALSSFAIKLPSAEDLEFPEMVAVTEATTFLPFSYTNTNTPSVVKKVDPLPLAKVENLEEVVYPKEDDLEFPKVLNSSLELSKGPEKKAAMTSHLKETTEKKILHERKIKPSELALGKKAKTSSQTNPRPPSARPALPANLKKRNDSYLLYLLVIFVLIILSLIFYYYTNILNKPMLAFK